MTAQATIDRVIELMQQVELDLYLSYRMGKEVVYVLVNPKTLISLSIWELKKGVVSGFFEKESEEHLIQLAFKKYVVQSGLTFAEAQRKARDHFQEFTGGTDGTTETSHQ